MRISHKVTAAASLVGVAIGGSLLVASLDASENKTEAPDSNDPAVFAKAFYGRVLSGDTTACEVFTSAGRRDFVKDMEPAHDCREAVQVLGNAVGPDHLFEFTRAHTYVLVSRDQESAVVRADFGGSADLMELHWRAETWRVGATTPETSPSDTE